MKINFDFVRIGNRRKNFTSEILIKQNSVNLRKQIRLLLKDELSTNKNNEQGITIIIPAKGLHSKFRLQDVKDARIRKLLKDNFSKFIYRGKLDLILDNIGNRIFY